MKPNDNCFFAVKHIQVLGHSVSARGLSSLESKAHAIVHASAPVDCKTSHSFLGLVVYYSNFNLRYVDVVEPLRYMSSHFYFQQYQRSTSCKPWPSTLYEKLAIVFTTDAPNIGLVAVF